jgi:hypothetical protein
MARPMQLAPRGDGDSVHATLRGRAAALTTCSMSYAPRLGTGEITTQESIRTRTPGWQVVLAPAQWTPVPIMSHPRTFHEAPLRATSYAQPAC